MLKVKMTPRKRRLEWVFCFLVACFLFSVDLSAQNYPPLVSEVLAETMLSSEIPALEYAMNNLPEGSPAHTLAAKKYHMYVHTWENLTIGRNVADALTSTFGEFATNANGANLNQDELPILGRNGLDTGDQTFNNLVTFLEQ